MCLRTLAIINIRTHVTILITVSGFILLLKRCQNFQAEAVREMGAVPHMAA